MSWISNPPWHKEKGESRPLISSHRDVDHLHFIFSVKAISIPDSPRDKSRPWGRVAIDEWIRSREFEELSSVVGQFFFVRSSSFISQGIIFQLFTYRHHRLLLIKTLSPRSLTSEITFIHTSLIPDSKNYHTWAYLHWLYAHFSSSTFSTSSEERISPEQWEEEIGWCEDMLREDGRNNSAWAWRWFLMFGRKEAKGGKKEIEWVNWLG